METYVPLPILIPFFTGVAALLLRRRTHAIRAISLTGATAGLLVALRLLAHVSGGQVLVSQMNAWPAPYGITFAIDLFGAIMLTLATLVGAVVLVYALNNIDIAREQMGFYALYHFMLMGVCGSFITGDLFNLYVFFEVMLLSSFGLMTLGGERGQLEGGLKYVVINMVSSTLFVSALGILYGTTGTLNMAHLSQRLAAAPPGLTTVLASMFTIAFGIKAGLFPFFSWLPASYHTPPPAITALFSGLLTKVGVYALIRTFTLIFYTDPAYLRTVFLGLAAMTMLTGILGALVQTGFRRALAFNLISHVGYIIMGLGLGSTAGLAGAIFYTVHHMIVMTGLLLVAGLAEQLTGTRDIHDMGGLWTRHPLLGASFFILALALAGIPPLSGFFGKFILVQAGLESQQYLVVALSLIVGLLTLYSMLQIWHAAFCKPAPTPASRPRALHSLAIAPIGLMVFLGIALGLGVQAVYPLTWQAAEALLERTTYITAVLGAGI